MPGICFKRFQSPVPMNCCNIKRLSQRILLLSERFAIHKACLPVLKSNPLHRRTPWVGNFCFAHHPIHCSALQRLKSIIQPTRNNPGTPSFLSVCLCVFVTFSVVVFLFAAWFPLFSASNRLLRNTIRRLPILLDHKCPAAANTIRLRIGEAVDVWKASLFRHARQISTSR